MSDLGGSMADVIANINRNLEAKKEIEKQTEILNFGHVRTDEEKAYYAEQIKRAEIEEKARKEREKAEINAKAEFEKWNKTVPKKYKNASFANADKNTPKERAVVAFIEKCKSAILCGPNGVGKTYLGYAACSKLIKQGKTAYLITAYKMFREIKRRFSTNTDEEYRTYLKNLDLLVVDEADKKYGSVTDFLNLCEIISDREAEELPTIIMTNADPDDLGEVLGKAVLDRVASAGKIIEMDWESKR
jgi:DNA replication protein DnaC